MVARPSFWKWMQIGCLMKVPGCHSHSPKGKGTFFLGRDCVGALKKKPRRFPSSTARERDFCLARLG
ncbi:hypothetical protein K1719_015473 [Acacia pycnantha]|nr:hypothetical protein K1719_015473 [Acacia pycnantha]